MFLTPEAYEYLATLTPDPARRVHLLRQAALIRRGRETLGVWL